MAFETHAFVDLQVNGFAGIDFNDPTTTAHDYQYAVPVLWSCGITRLFPTIITGEQRKICRCLMTVALAAELPAIGPSIAGIHLEGPWISPLDGPRGAHPVDHVRIPDKEAFRLFQESAQGRIRIVTLAPEIPGAMEMIEWLVSQGVIVSIGHTAASAAQIADAVSAGARLSTHVGNGCAETMHRHLNPIWPQLADDRLTASFIADGHHLPAPALQSMLRAKGVARSFLVSDATAAAACAPGTYRFGEVAIERSEAGRVQMPGTTRLAGSALRLDDAVTNVKRMAGVTWEGALAMAGPQAAAAAGLSFPNDRVSVEIITGNLVNGNPGDERLVVRATIREGETIWQQAH